VQPYLDRTRQVLQRLNGRHQLHAVVRGLRGFAAADLLDPSSVPQYGAPSARTWIAAAGAIGEDLDDPVGRLACHSHECTG
jgi:hypothetical protein